MFVGCICESIFLNSLPSFQAFFLFLATVHELKFAQYSVVDKEFIVLEMQLNFFWTFSCRQNFLAHTLLLPLVRRSTFQHFIWQFHLNLNLNLVCCCCCWYCKPRSVSVSVAGLVIPYIFLYFFPFALN